MQPATLLFAGETLDGRDPDHSLVALRDGSKLAVRVRIVAARHLLVLLDLFDTGKEAELLERTVELKSESESESGKGTLAPSSALAVPAWQPATPELIDSLDDGSHERLVVGEQHPDRAHAAPPNGRSARTVKPPPSLGPASREPPIAAALSRIPVIPNPPPGLSSRALPLPSSDTEIVSDAGL